MGQQDSSPSKLKVKIYAYDLNSNEAIRQHTIDLNSDLAQEWLRRFTVWAVLNKKSVEIINVRDDEPAVRNEVS